VHQSEQRDWERNVLRVPAGSLLTSEEATATLLREDGYHLSDIHLTPWDGDGTGDRDRCPMGNLRVDKSGIGRASNVPVSAIHTHWADPTARLRRRQRAEGGDKSPHSKSEFLEIDFVDLSDEVVELG
jgi:hypothetical protein